MRNVSLRRAVWLHAAVCLAVAGLLALEGRAEGQVLSSQVEAASEPPQAKAAPADPPGLVRLDPRFPVWIDKQKKRIVMIGRVCLREGQLEMFACLEGTKEHESIVAVPTEALDVHAGLVAVGAEPGHPARFVPEYRPATGTVIGVMLFWTDEKGDRRRARGQDWVRDVKTRSAMRHPWVFGGSGFWTDPTTGQQYYQAEQGDFICVSNFPSALLDLPIESSDQAGALLFEAFTERIPPLGTKVTVVLTPHLEEHAKAKPDSEKPDSEKPGSEKRDIEKSE